MLFTILSLLCLIRATNEASISGWWIFWGGIAGGFSWCIRNVSVALFVASVLYLTAQTLRVGMREGMRGTTKWMVGWMLGCGWLIGRNMSTFGVVNPYHMPQSDVSFVRNAVTALYVIGADLTAFGSFSYLVANKYVLVALCLVLMTGSVLLWRRIRWIPRSKIVSLLREHNSAALFGVFFIVYVLTIIVARSRYQWGENINSRHFVPVYWILIWGIVSIAVSMCSFTRRRMYWAALTVALGLMTVLQVRYPVNRFKSLVWHQKAQNINAVSRDEAKELGREVPRDKIVLTDDIARLRVFGNINARMIPSPQHQFHKESALTWQEIRDAGDSGVLWGIVVVNMDNLVADKYGAAIKDVLRSSTEVSGFRIRKLGGGGVIAEYVASREGPQKSLKAGGQ